MRGYRLKMIFFKDKSIKNMSSTTEKEGYNAFSKIVELVFNYSQENTAISIIDCYQFCCDKDPTNFYLGNFHYIYYFLIQDIFTLPVRELAGSMTMISIDYPNTREFHGGITISKLLY